MRFLVFRLKFGLFLLSIAPFFAVAAHAATYYVSPTGSDANDGTSAATAWQSVNKVNTVNFSEGDTILFEAGRVFSGSLYFDAQDRGTAGNPITIGSFGSGRATINAGNTAGFLAYNTAGIRLKGLIFRGAGTASNTKDGVSFFTDLPGNVKLAGITIENVTASGFGNCGVQIGSWNNQTGYRDIRIINVVAHDNLHAGIATYAQIPRVHSNVHVARSRAYNNYGNPRSAKNTGSGIVLGGVTEATIERCVAYNNGRNNFAPTEGPVGIWTYDSARVTIQHNESYANRTGSGKDGGGFDLDINVQDSVMQYNYSHDNDGAGYLLCDSPSNSGNVIRYNISQNDGRKNGYAAIHTYGNIHNADIYNNTIYMAQTAGSPRAVLLAGGTTNVRFRNNIFYSSGGARLVEIQGAHNGLLFQGNCYFANGAFSIVQAGAAYSSLPHWRSAAGQEKLNGSAVGISEDPQLTAPGQGGVINDANALATLSAYKLRPGSTLIDRGLNLNSLGSDSGAKDFFGNSAAQGGGFDIGAHEMTGQGTPAPSTPATPVPTPTQPDLAGKPQIFFQHVNRRVSFWGMQDTQFVGSRLVRNGVPVGIGWRFVAAADFDKNGSRDLVFQHQKGHLAVWKLQGDEFLGSQLLRSGASPGPQWRAVTTADFNGDSHEDVLFQNGSGQMRIWFMQGPRFVSGVTLAKLSGPQWKAFGARDFDGDGKADILFQHADGRLVTWLMNGVAFVRKQELRGMAPNSGWRLAGLVDLDQNGHTDFLWQHANGRLSVWKYDRLAFQESKLLRSGKPAGVGWRAIGPR